MLESSSLYFARADKLSDPFEGTYSRGNALLRPIVYEEVYRDIAKESIEKLETMKADMAKWTRKRKFINCWHMNDGESAAMWQLYAKSNEAIAIRSTYSRLATVLDEQTYLGIVNYIDFEKDWVPEDNAFYPFVHKRKSFSHENEVRALCSIMPKKDETFDWSDEPIESGIKKVVDLDHLIEQVYVAPTAPTWFSSLVHQVCKTYKLQKPIFQSALDAEPFY